MDLRVVKTRKNIREAFLALRAKKPLERITVKELCEKALINKTTFYLHYPSIFDLSEVLENELIESCFSSLPKEELLQPEKMVIAFYRAFSEQRELFRILFSGNRIEVPARKAELFMKKQLFAAYPELESDLRFRIRFTAIVYGCFHAYLEYNRLDVEEVMSHLSEIAGEVIPVPQPHEE